MKSILIQQSNVLPSHISKSIEKSIKQYEGGKTISLQQFKEKHLRCLKTSN